MAGSGFDKRFARAAKLLAANVRRLRKAKGLTQDDLAALKIEQQAVSLIENSRSNPTVLVLAALAKALDADLADLFDAKTRIGRSGRNEDSPRRPRRPRTKP
jgi:transcriptional regulator with XRE-family HTH domain